MRSRFAPLRFQYIISRRTQASRTRFHRRTHAPSSAHRSTRSKGQKRGWFVTLLLVSKSSLQCHELPGYVYVTCDTDNNAPADGAFAAYCSIVEQWLDPSANDGSVGGGGCKLSPVEIPAPMVLSAAVATVRAYPDRRRRCVWNDSNKKERDNIPAPGPAASHHTTIHASSTMSGLSPPSALGGSAELPPRPAAPARL